MGNTVFYRVSERWSLQNTRFCWVKPIDYWLFQDVNQRVSLEMMKRFEAEGIEFAFPSQTLYVSKADE